MAKTISMIALSLLFSYSAWAQESEYRTWTSSDGAFESRARLKSIGPIHLQLQKPNGQVIEVRPESLSNKDLLFLVRHLQSKVPKEPEQTSPKLRPDSLDGDSGLDDTTESLNAKVRRAVKDTNAAIKEALRLETSLQIEEALKTAFVELDVLDGTPVEFDSKVSNVRTDGRIVFSSDNFFKKYSVFPEGIGQLSISTQLSKEQLKKISPGTRVKITAELYAGISASTYASSAYLKTGGSVNMSFLKTPLYKLGTLGANRRYYRFSIANVRLEIQDN